MLLHIVVFFLVTLLDGIHTQDPRCQQGEYWVQESDSNEGQCCPMCGTGSRVNRDCTSTRSTSCIPCGHGTYMDHPNGLSNCLRCRSCDSGLALNIKYSCTDMKNTVCGCQLGYYCKEPNGEDCNYCSRHKVCESGSKVKSYGTDKRDTVCEPCPDGTFSIGNMSDSCAAWTSCPAQGRIKAHGTHISDTVCDEPESKVIPIVVGIIVVVLIALAVAVIVFYRKRIRLEYRKVRKKQDTKRKAGDDAEEQLEERRPRKQAPEERQKMIPPIQESQRTASVHTVDVNNGDAASQPQTSDPLEIPAVL